MQNSPARAVICPHAGYRYSGPTAAYSFRQIDPRWEFIIIHNLFWLYCIQGCEDHLCSWSFPPCSTFWMCCHPARRLPNSPLWSQVESFQYQLGWSSILLQHQYRNQSRSPQHRPLWNNDSGSWWRWAQHWNATPLHSQGGRREPQLVFLSHHIDLQQVYLLQSEALKDKTLMFVCDYSRHHGRIKHSLTINVSYRWWSLQEESSTLSLWWWVNANLYIFWISIMFMIPGG